MDKTISLQVDIFDKDAIKARLPELLVVIEAKRRELDELESRYEQLRVWAGYAGREARNRTAHRSGPTKRTIQQEAIDIVNTAGRPMTTMDVVVAMDREKAPSSKTVNWSLWNAARHEILKSMGDGRYAPLDYEDESLLPPDNGVGAHGMESSAPVAGDGS